MHTRMRPSLTHSHSYEQARRIDGATVRAILGFDAEISHEQACGATPVAGALIAAKRKGLAPKLLDCRNSGDTAGGRDQVVGYASFALAPESPRYEAEHGRKLLQIARASISEALGTGSRVQDVNEPWLKEWRASFVTLQLGEELRGCVGTLEAQRPLADDVAENARAAAFQDTRFKPLAREEFSRTDIEVSLLSAPKRLLFEDHADLIAQLRPGVDGIILEQGDGEKRATFLPQVWEGLPDPEQFIAHLKQKAGIPQRPGGKETAQPFLPGNEHPVLRYRGLQSRLQVLPELGHLQVARHRHARRQRESRAARALRARAGLQERRLHL